MRARRLRSRIGPGDTFRAGVQQIADPLYGLDQRRAGRVWFKLGAKAGHPNAKVGQLAFIVGAPYVFQHLVCGHSTARAGRQLLQQQAFFAGKRQFLSLPADLAALCVDLQSVNAKHCYTASSAGFFP
jgi:hypothetical protein